MFNTFSQLWLLRKKKPCGICRFVELSGGWRCSGAGAFIQLQKKKVIFAASFGSCAC